jgi:hypothetical protein
VSLTPAWQGYKRCKILKQSDCNGLWGVIFALCHPMAAIRCLIERRAGSTTCLKFGPPEVYSTQYSCDTAPPPSSKAAAGSAMHADPYTRLALQGLLSLSQLTQQTAARHDSIHFVECPDYTLQCGFSGNGPAPRVPSAVAMPCRLRSNCELVCAPGLTSMASQADAFHFSPCAAKAAARP